MPDQADISYRDLPAKFPVQHLCSYLADWSGFSPREQDKEASRIVACLKGGATNGPASLKIGGMEVQLEGGTSGRFLERVWAAVGQLLATGLDGRAAIVPIPDSSATVGEAPSHRMLSYAQSIAAHSGGKLVAVDGLRWRRGAMPGYRAKNQRFPAGRYDALVVTCRPRIPIILFDDTITSGSSLIAAYWRLQDAGDVPTRALVVARRILAPRSDMFAGGEREIEIPER